MRRMKDQIEATVSNATSAAAVENLDFAVDVASSGQSADITLSSLDKTKSKFSVGVTGVATVAKKDSAGITIDVPNQNDLLNALTNDDIDAITGGMVDDDGNPLPTPQVVVDATLTVSGRAADAKVTGTRISEALSIAKSADAGLTNVRTELDKLKLDSVAVDKTLTKENFAADAKAVGNALAKKASTKHTHSAGDINSGTLPIARGGTGAIDALTAYNSLSQRGTVGKDTDWNTLDAGVWVVAQSAWTTGKNQPEGLYTYGTV